LQFATLLGFTHKPHGWHAFISWVTRTRWCPTPEFCVP
jgi:hypothetical protein